MTALDTLKSKFDIPGVLTFSAGNGGLPRVTITAPAGSAEVYLNGACVTHFQPQNKPPLIFCSRTSKFENGKAIRGGVPIIFPWFGPHPTDPKLPQHGFVRSAEWDVAAAEAGADGTARVVFVFNSTDETLAIWPFPFSLQFTVNVGASLEMALEVTNWAPRPFTYQEALHTYLTVSDIERTSIAGLEHAAYIDKVDGATRNVQGSEPIVLTGETDRVYLGVQGPVTVHDPERGPIFVRKENSLCTVVWNPWEHKAEALADLAGSQWPHMLCVEAANTAEYEVTLAPGATHTMRTTIASA